MPYDDIIKQRSIDVLKNYIDGVERNVNVHKSVRAWTIQTSHDYANRVPLELIQNAYDAQKGHTESTIHLELDKNQGEFGSLYIANHGDPFLKENFEAICEMGLSSKSPDESIGNKGVGFRSVLQVCPYPQIYSMDNMSKSSDHFNGFCFSFAKDEDIDNTMALINNSPLKDKAKKEVSRYSLPVPLDNQNKKIKKFAQAGYSTVICLPLVSKNAYKVIEDQLRIQLMESEVPVILFLDGLSKLTIKIIGRDSIEDHELTRDTEALNVQSISVSDRYSIASLGEYGDFLLASVVVDKNLLQNSINESIESNLVPENWKDWQGSAEVSIAVPLRLKNKNSKFRYYNFLPLGEESLSPIHGFINAPFYTQANRKNLDQNIPLNSFFIEQTAKLSIRSIFALIATLGDKQNKYPWLANTIIDLLCWDEAYNKQLETIFKELGHDIRTAKIIPANEKNGENTFSAISAIYTWPDDNLNVLKRVTLLSSKDIELTSKEIDTERLLLLENFIKPFYSDGLTPSCQLIGECIEAIADKKSGKKFKRSFWEGFYDDLATLFDQRKDSEGKNVNPAECLNGRRILICEDNKLRPFIRKLKEARSKKQPLVFFKRQIVRGSNTNNFEEDIKVPSILNRYFSFIHPALRWYVGQRKEMKPSRSFLEQFNIVREYKAEELISNIAGILKRTKSDNVRREALLWVYKIYPTVSSSKTIKLDEQGIYVPAKSDQWLPAKEVFFSSEWGTENGSELERFIEDTAEISEEINELKKHLLISPTDWPGNIENRGQLLEYLKATGVRDGIFPIRCEGKYLREGNGGEFTPERLSLDLELNNEDAEDFKRASKILGSTVNTKLYTPHQLTGDFWIIPGQKEYIYFSTEAKQRYANLIISSCKKWDDETLIVTLQGRNTAWGYNYKWPTPCLAFMLCKKWLPVRSNDQLQQQFRCPEEAWYFKPSDKRQPTYIPFLTTDLITKITAHNLASSLQERIRLRIWESEQDFIEQLKLLGSVFLGGNVDTGQLNNFRYEYRLIWERLIDIEEPLNRIEADTTLVLSNEGRLIARSISDLSSDSNISFFVKGESAGIRGEILDELECYQLTINKAINDERLNKITSLTGLPFQVIDKLKMEVLVDGEPIEKAQGSILFLDYVGRWFLEFIAVAVASKAQLPAMKTPGYREKLLNDIERLTIVPAKNIKILINNQELRPPASFDNTFPFRSEKGLFLAVKDFPNITKNDFLLKVTPSLCHVFKIAQISDSVKLGLMELFNSNPYVEESRSLAPKLIADIFKEKESVVNEIVSGIRSDLEFFYEKIAPIIKYLEAEESSSITQNIYLEFETQESLINTLKNLMRDAEFPVPTDILNMSLRSDSCYSLRDILELNFERFNHILLALGAPYKPELNTDDHYRCFENFKKIQRKDILKPLRNHFLQSFQKFEDLSEYLNLRNLDRLVYDDSLVITCKEPSDKMMWSLVENWWESNNIQKETWNTEILPDFDEVREQNRSNTKKFQNDFDKIIGCWSRMEERDPPTWVNETSGDFAVFNILDQLGALDFSVLNYETIARWLAFRNEWPAEMNAVADISQWNLTNEDILNFKDAAQHEKRKKRKRTK